MVREFISKMKNGKAAGLSDVLSEMVQTVGEGAGMITDLINQIIAEVNPAKWELRTIANCYDGKDDSLE